MKLLQLLCTVAAVTTAIHAANLSSEKQDSILEENDLAGLFAESESEKKPVSSKQEVAGEQKANDEDGDMGLNKLFDESKVVKRIDRAQSDDMMAPAKKVPLTSAQANAKRMARLKSILAKHELNLGKVVGFLGDIQDKQKVIEAERAQVKADEYNALEEKRVRLTGAQEKLQERIKQLQDLAQKLQPIAEAPEAKTLNNDLLTSQKNAVVEP